MNRYIKSVLTLCIVMVLVLLNNTHVFAKDDHIAEKSYFSDIIYAIDIIGDEKPDESIEIYREEGIISNPQIKGLSNNWNQETNTIKSNNGYDASLVMGGNMDAINHLATKQHIARADMTENVGEDGKEFEMKLDDEENSTSKQTRQFITFTTNSGKTFHLIVDHEKASQNVFLLTEVGEQDLLNMIEGEKSNINVKPVMEEPKEEEHKEEENKEVKEKPKRKNKFSFIFVLLILGIVGGGGYYFKIYKPNHEDYEDEDEDEDYEDELAYENQYGEEFGEDELREE